MRSMLDCTAFWDDGSASTHVHTSLLVKPPVKRQGASLINFENNTTPFTPLERWNVKRRAIAAIEEYRYILFISPVWLLEHGK